MILQTINIRENRLNSHKDWQASSSFEPRNNIQVHHCDVLQEITATSIQITSVLLTSSVDVAEVLVFVADGSAVHLDIGNVYG